MREYMIFLSSQREPVFCDTLEDTKEYIKKNMLLGIATIYRKTEEIKYYKTLREYINEHSIGAYHYFEFEFPLTNFTVKVMNVGEFEKYFKKDLLDEYVVCNVRNEKHGSNCENFVNIHHLLIEKIVKDGDKND